MPSINAALASAALIAAFPLSAARAQPAAPDARTGGLLVADTTLDAIYLVRDADGDGIAETATVFFGAGNDSGLINASNNILALFQADDQTVYFSDGDTDTVYAIRDNNGDGDAMDPGEAIEWFISGLGNNLNWVMQTPGGIASIGGAIFIVNAGVGSTPDDAIYRTVDLNGDDDANDLNECVRWFDASSNIASSTPFELCFIGDAAYLADLRGGDPDAIFRLRDADIGGEVEAGEFGVFLLDGDHGAACDFSCITDGTSIFTHNQTGTQSIFKLRDLNESDSINQAAEVDIVWNESALPSGSVLQTSFTIAQGPTSPLRTMAISSHGTAAQDSIFLLRDLDGSDDFLQSDETTAFYTGTAGDGVFPESIRSMAFYAPVCRGDFDRSGIKNVPDIFAFLSAWFANDSDADVDGVPGVAVPDIFAFLSLWFGPC